MGQGINEDENDEKFILLELYVGDIMYISNDVR